MSDNHKTCPYISGGVICKKFKKNENQRGCKMSDDMKRLIVVLQSKGQVITTEDVEYISGVISENEWLGFEEEAENEFTT